MKKSITLLLIVAFFWISNGAHAQFVIKNDSIFKTADQMLLANELNTSGEPFAEALGYNLDDLNPMVPNAPDSTSYTLGIENYEYSRYLLAGFGSTIRSWACISCGRLWLSKWLPWNLPVSMALLPVEWLTALTKMMN